MADRKTSFDLPYHNLILTGFLGVGKTTVARYISQKFNTDYFDVDDNIVLRELMSISKIREQYGDARLKKLEYELCREAALKRRSIIVVPGAALLDERVYDLLNETGLIVVLTCELGEALRRLHLANEQRYRDPDGRGRLLSRIRRESQVVQDDRLIQLDTTHLSIQEEGDLLTELWFEGKTNHPMFRRGPGDGIRPPKNQLIRYREFISPTTPSRTLDD